MSEAQTTDTLPGFIHSDDQQVWWKQLPIGAELFGRSEWSVPDPSGNHSDPLTGIIETTVAVFRVRGEMDNEYFTVDLHTDRVIRRHFGCEERGFQPLTDDERKAMRRWNETCADEQWAGRRSPGESPDMETPTMDVVIRQLLSDHRQILQNLLTDS